MPGLILHSPKCKVLLTLVLFGQFLATVSHARAASVAVVVPQPLTKEEVKQLKKTANSAEDHTRLARYYAAEADRLDTLAADYAVTAEYYRDRPAAKNVMAPNTAARFDAMASTCRRDAKANRKLAAYHDMMAGDAAAREASK